MKIEMGESLFYSWLRHVKGCQIVQTNWKPTKKGTWETYDDERVEKFFKTTSTKFDNIFGEESFEKVCAQAETDLIGIRLTDKSFHLTAVEVAFHKGGLNYGNGKSQDIQKVKKKLITNALCISRYFNTNNADIIFSTPKISPKTKAELDAVINEINTWFEENGYEFKAQLIANEEFNEKVLKPVIKLKDNVEDTSELFLRSCQLWSVFNDK